MASRGTRTEDDNPTPLEAVLRRLSDGAGFPTLSTTISDINRVVASEAHSAQQLAQIILRDTSLTTKLLQLVNSATYGVYRGRIRTISKAVLILGADTVRSAAMTLMLLEFSRGRAQERSLQDELIGAFCTGVISKALYQRVGAADSEEAVITAMFHSLGKLLVIFFLYDESREVQALIGSGLAEDDASRRVLGLTYRELGVGVARQWNLPERLVESMQSLPPTEIVSPKSEVETLRITANLANDLYTTALRCSPADKAAALEALTKRYGSAIKIDAKALTQALDQGLKEIAERSTTLNLPVAGSAALNVVRIWTGGSEHETEDTAQSKGVGDDTLLHHVATLDALESKDEPASDANQVLSAGIRDVIETLTGDFTVNDVLQMVLETMYRGMGFSRTLVFIRDNANNTMRARFGFGLEVERIIPQCTFPLAFAPDVFHVAMEKGVDIVIENTQAEKVAQRIPQWHRQLVNAKSFLLLPVVLRNHTVGLLYADSEKPEGIKINTEQLGLLRTLRSQVVLAFKQSGGATGAAR